MIIFNSAIIFDDTGRFLYRIKFKNNQSVVTYDERSYNINTKASHKETHFRFFVNFVFRDYYYSLNDPNPLILDKKCEPIYDARMYNKTLFTKVLTEANNMVRPAWMNLISFPIIAAVFIGIVLIMIVLGYYFG